MAVSESGDRAWSGEHTVDARYRVPWFGGPIYLRVMLGRERRPTPRVARESARNIRRRAATAIFFVFGACLFYTVAAVALLLVSAVLE